jgi:hypothetical protein
MHRRRRFEYEHQLIVSTNSIPPDFAFSFNRVRFMLTGLQRAENGLVGSIGSDWTRQDQNRRKNSCKNRALVSSIHELFSEKQNPKPLKTGIRSYKRLAIIGFEKTFQLCTQQFDRPMNPFGTTIHWKNLTLKTRALLPKP